MERDGGILPRARDLMYIGALLLGFGVNMGVAQAQISGIEDEVSELASDLDRLDLRANQIPAVAATLESVDQRLERIENLLDRRNAP